MFKDEEATARFPPKSSLQYVRAIAGEPLRPRASKNTKLADELKRPEGMKTALRDAAVQSTESNES